MPVEPKPTILKSAALVVEKFRIKIPGNKNQNQKNRNIPKTLQIRSEYSKEAELEDEVPDACQNNNKGEK